MAYPGKVSLSFVQEKITQLFPSSPGTKAVLDCSAVPCRAGRLGGLHPLCVLAEGCSETLCHECSTLNRLRNPWLIRSPAFTLPGAMELPWRHSFNYCFAGGYQKSWGWRSALPCAFICLVSGVCPQTGVYPDSSKRKRKTRRAQQSFIH